MLWTVAFGALIASVCVFVGGSQANAQDGSPPTTEARPERPDGASGDSESDNVPVDVEMLIEDEMAYWQFYRGHFGFNLDKPTILAIARSKIGAASIDEYSAPFSVSEQNEIKRRFVMEDEASELYDDLAREDAFGGMWVDNSGGGLVHIAFVGTTPEELAMRINSAFTEPERVIAERVEVSLMELEAAQDRIVAAARDDNRASSGLPQLSGAFVDHESNTLVVQVTSDVSVKDRIAIAIHARVPTRAEVAPLATTDACVSREDCGPKHRGGVELDDGGRCSSSFVATKSNGNDYLITAGHCEGNTAGQAVEISGNPSSSVHKYRSVDNAYGDQSKADAVPVGIADTERSNRIYRRSSQKYYAIKNIGLGAHVNGTTVCIAAIVVDYRCGTILNGNHTANQPGGITLLKQVQWTWLWSGHHKCGQTAGSIIGSEGSSGGAMIRGNKAMGGHTSCASASYIGQPVNATTMVSTYSKIKNIQIALDMTVRTTM